MSDRSRPYSVRRNAARVSSRPTASPPLSVILPLYGGEADLLRGLEGAAPGPGRHHVTAPPLSVVLPVYNGEAHLDEAIRSIRTQTFTDFEFIVIDDGSSDRTLEILEEHAREDERMRVRTRANRGLIDTLNEGLAMARGDLVARMDADDIALPARFERQVAHMSETPECVLLGSSFDFIDEAGAATRPYHCFIHDVTIRHALPIEGAVLHPAAILRRSAALRVGGYRPGYVAAEDYDLWHRLAHIGRLGNLAESLMRYREWAGRVSTRDAEAQRRIADRIRDQIWNDRTLARYRRVSLRSLFRLPGEHAPGLEELQRQLARMALKRGDLRLFGFLARDLVRFRAGSSQDWGLYRETFRK
jgi:glycosyltransferase involved in cell wall biosynthesis